MTTNADTAERYAFALEHAGFAVRCLASADDAAAASLDVPPVPAIVQFTPRLDPQAVGTALRRASPSTPLIGLLLMQLQVATLKNVLDAPSTLW